MFKLCPECGKRTSYFCAGRVGILLFCWKKLVFRAFFLSLPDIQNFLLLSTPEGSCSCLLIGVNFAIILPLCSFISFQTEGKTLRTEQTRHSVRPVPCKHYHIPSLLIAVSSFSSQVAAKRICEVCRRTKPINKIPTSNPGEGKTWLSGRMEGLGRWRARKVRAGAEAVWINTGDGANTSCGVF